MISSINYTKKRAMQRNNREAIRQKSNSHTFVDDADFFYNVTHSSLRRRPQTITQQRKHTFRTVWAVLAIVFFFFLVFCKEFMWKMTNMQYSDRIIRRSLYKWHGKEKSSG